MGTTNSNTTRTITQRDVRSMLGTVPSYLEIGEEVVHTHLGKVLCIGRAEVNGQKVWTLREEKA